MVTLPRLQHDPREDWKKEGGSPVEWVAPLGCWCVFDAGIITRILKSTRFAAIDFVDLHRDIERKVGIDCSTLITGLAHSPLGAEGARHARNRHVLARMIAAGTPAAKDRASAVAQDVIRRLCSGSKVDVVEQIILPVCDALFEGLLGVGYSRGLSNGGSASQVFDSFLGLNRRRQINTDARALLDDFSCVRDSLSSTPEFSLALTMIGYDSIVGSLGASLLKVLHEGKGARLCDLKFSNSLPVTGVPYIERLATEDCELAGAAIKQGDRLRLFLDSGEPGGQDEERPYFGRGRHSCLGEDLSNWLWRMLSGELASLPLAYTLESVTRRKPDWVFVYHSSLVVHFHA